VETDKVSVDVGRRDFFKLLGVVAVSTSLPALASNTVNTEQKFSLEKHVLYLRFSEDVMARFLVPRWVITEVETMEYVAPVHAIPKIVLFQAHVVYDDTEHKFIKGLEVDTVYPSINGVYMSLRELKAKFVEGFRRIVA
jgi:hypothetical protein